MKVCVLCGAKRFARKLCRMHYERLVEGRAMARPKYASRLTADQVSDILHSPDSLRVVAQRNGIGSTYAQLIRAGKRKPVVQ